MTKANKILKFSSFIILGAITGFAAAYFGKNSQEQVETFRWDGQGLGLFPLDVMYVIFALAGLSAWVASIVYFSKMKKEKDEEVSERLLGNAMIPNAFGFLLMMMSTLILLSQMISQELETVAPISMLFSTIFILFTTIVMQFVLLSTFNKQFPKRSIDIFGPKKSYIEKLDEAEKFIVYKSSYKALSNTNITMYLLTVLTFVYSTLWEFQLFPFLILLTLFIVNNMSYFRESMK